MLQKNEKSHVVCNRFVTNIFVTLCAILLVYIIVWLGSEIRNNVREFKHIGLSDRIATNYVTVDGVGEVTAQPTVAKVHLGLVTEAKTVSEAQKKNTEIMNKLQKRFLELGIDEKDIQTKDFLTQPQYTYTGYENKLNGYSVTHTVEVKVRNIDAMDQLLATAVQYGANQVSGVEFTIEDKDELLAQARVIALRKAQDKIKTLAQTLGVRVVRVTGFSEYVPDDGNTPPPYYGGVYSDVGFAKDTGRATAGNTGGNVVGPELSIGSQKVKVVVTVNYEIE